MAAVKLARSLARTERRTVLLGERKAKRVRRGQTLKDTNQLGFVGTRRACSHDIDAQQTKTSVTQRTFTSDNHTNPFLGWAVRVVGRIQMVTAADTVKTTAAEAALGPSVARVACTNGVLAS